MEGQSYNDTMPQYFSNFFNILQFWYNFQAEIFYVFSTIIKLAKDCERKLFSPQKDKHFDTIQNLYNLQKIKDAVPRKNLNVCNKIWTWPTWTLGTTLVMVQTFW